MLWMSSLLMATLLPHGSGHPNRTMYPAHTPFILLWISLNILHYLSYLFIYLFIYLIIIISSISWSLTEITLPQSLFFGCWNTLNRLQCRHWLGTKRSKCGSDFALSRRGVGGGTLGLSCGIWHQSVGVGVDSLSPLGCEECILMIGFFFFVRASPQMELEVYNVFCPSLH